MPTVDKIRVVIVLFHPDDEAIEMVKSFQSRGQAPVAVVNAIDPARLTTLREAAVDVIINSGNVGLALALNQGIEHAFQSGTDYVMLLDQDTRPPPEMVDRLQELAIRCAGDEKAVGCIGPLPVDRKRPDARTIAGKLGVGKGDLAEATTVITSGMLISRQAFEVVGGMWNELFIDQIDHEWCFRARAAGFAILVAPGVYMPHNMGDDGFAFFGRYKPIHRSPIRHYHIVRNTLWLARCSFIPLSWRTVEMLKLAIRIPSYLMLSSARGATLRAIFHAFIKGLQGPPNRTLFASLAPATEPSIL